MPRNAKASSKGTRKRPRSPSHDEEDDYELEESSSIDSSISDDYTSDDLSEDGEEEKHVPLKKRRGTLATVEADSESSDAEFHDEYDEDLMGDAEDRNRLFSLPQLEREAILAERYEKREAARERWEMERKLKAKKKGARLRRGAKSVNRMETKKSALSHMKAERAARKSRAKMKHEMESLYGDGGTSAAQRTSEAARSSSPKPAQPPRRPHLDEVNSIRLTRKLLESWVDKPFFDETVPGFFVRIGVGYNKQKGMSMYRCVRVEKVQLGMIYKLGNVETDKSLQLSQGKSKKTFKMEFVSNSRIQESELSAWYAKICKDRRKEDRLSEEYFDEKRTLLAEASNYILTDADVLKMLKEKKRLKKAKGTATFAGNYAMEKTRLSTEIERAREDGNSAREQKLLGKLKMLEEARKNAQGKDTSSALKKLAKINERNKQRNVRASHKVSESSVTNDDGEDVDPFKRRATKPMAIMFSSSSRAALDDEPEKPSSEADPSIKKEPAQEAKDKSRELKDAHNFDLDLSTIADPASPSSKPKPKKKRKKSRSKVKTMSLTEYKKRMEMT